MRAAPLVDRILHVKAGQQCIIVGTVYKEMRLKPNILDEYHAREVRHHHHCTCTRIHTASAIRGAPSRAQQVRGGRRRVRA